MNIVKTESNSRPKEIGLCIGIHKHCLPPQLCGDRRVQATAAWCVPPFKLMASALWRRRRLASQPPAHVGLDFRSNQPVTALVDSQVRFEPGVRLPHCFDNPQHPRCIKVANLVSVQRCALRSCIGVIVIGYNSTRDMCKYVSEKMRTDGEHAVAVSSAETDWHHMPSNLRAT
jgi:hypothetical protein